MHDDIVLFGAPWAGKWTQAELIIQDNPDTFSWLSSWDVFRALTEKPNAIGDYIDEQLTSGGLITDDITISLFNAYFYTTLDAGKRMLLDWYPRTIPQLDALFAISKKHWRNLRGLFFDLDEKESTLRMKSRWRAGEDDTVIAKRFAEYYEHTKPLVDAFWEQCELITIDASGSIEDIQKVVKNYL
jgi:adenylate kinase